MIVKKTYIVLTTDGLTTLYYTEDDKYFLFKCEELVWIPDFEAERLISLFTKVEHHSKI